MGSFRGVAKVTLWAPAGNFLSFFQLCEAEKSNFFDFFQLFLNFYQLSANLQRWIGQLERVPKVAFLTFSTSEKVTFEWHGSTQLFVLFQLSGNLQKLLSKADEEKSLTFSSFQQSK